jgi:hypothetical protein
MLRIMRDQPLPTPRYVRVWVVPLLVAFLGLGLVAVSLPSLRGCVRGVAVLSAVVWVVLAGKIHRAEARKE